MDIFQEFPSKMLKVFKIDKNHIKYFRRVKWMQEWIGKTAPGVTKPQLKTHSTVLPKNSKGQKSQ